MFFTEKGRTSTAIKTLRAYLRIRSVHPDVNYKECVEFLTQLAKKIGFDCEVYEFLPRKPIVVMIHRGKDPSLGGIMLNSHMDVVTADAEKWKHDPFGAEMDSKGNIYARGVQDTKALGIMYVEALRRIVGKGKIFLRNIYITFVPDEEEGDPGMRLFAASDKFKALNVAFVIDEGLANPGPECFLFYGEKTIWHVKFVIKGTGGAGSEDLRDTAGEKLRRLLDQAMRYRRQQQQILDKNPKLTVSDITFINFTVVQGGNASRRNEAPEVMSAVFDIRIGTNENVNQLSEMLEEWAKNAGKDVTILFVEKDKFSPATAIDHTNPFWIVMKDTLDSLKVKLAIGVMPAGTDSRFLRSKGIPCISFTPINNTPPLAHAIDEYVNKKVFIRGIDIFHKLIPALANMNKPTKQK